MLFVGTGGAQGSLHPAGSLYEKPVNTRKSIEQHRQFVRVLEENGPCLPREARPWRVEAAALTPTRRTRSPRATRTCCTGVTVLDVRDILILDTDTSVGARLRLEEFAATRLVYQMDKSCGDRARDGDDYYISNDYKKKVLAAMSADQLADIVMTNPTVTILPSGRDTYFTAAYSFQPLSNSVFTRDQQVTTRKAREASSGDTIQPRLPGGHAHPPTCERSACLRTLTPQGIVMANLSSAQRRNEVELMKFCFNKLGLKVIAEIPEDGRLEGGDFFPAGTGGARRPCRKSLMTATHTRN